MRKFLKRSPRYSYRYEKEEAEKLGAEQEFGVMYPNIVSVYSVGPLDNAFSIEFCGGLHVSNTRVLAVGNLKFSKKHLPPASAASRRC